MVHGGAGALDNLNNKKEIDKFIGSLRDILEHGRDILQADGSALETAEKCACLLENDPLYNAGYGSVLNEDGKVEMDAAIMSGIDLKAGAVAAVNNIANPIQLARLVMTKSEHVLLVGEGAMRFADRCKVSRATDEYFLLPERVEQYKSAHKINKVILDHEEVESVNELTEDQKYGTIGVVVRDCMGNLAAATSTGGIVNKRLGRVGDSPLVGCGVFADNETCAASATGYGEDFIRTVICKTISDFVYMKGMNAIEATKMGIEYLVRKVKGRGGVIVIDRNGHCASGFTTKKMIHGWIEHGGESIVRF